MTSPNRPSASIQAYFPPTPTSTPSPTKPSPDPAPIGDGFTPSELQRALHPPEQLWSPPTEYEDVEIAELRPGPGPVTFMGRVANLFDVGVSGKGEKRARGCLKVCVRDGGGGVTVRPLSFPSYFSG